MKRHQHTLLIACIALCCLVLHAGATPAGMEDLGIRIEATTTANWSKISPDSTQDELKLGRDVDYRKGKADAYLIFAELEENKGDLTLALRYYFSALYEEELIGDSIAVAEINVRIGHIFNRNFLYLKALEFYSSAELTFLNSGLIEGQTSLLMDIASMYFELEEYDEAILYYGRTAAISENKGAKYEFIQSKYRMVECHIRLGEYENARNLNETVLSYYRDSGDWTNEVIALNNMGYIMKNLGVFDEALAYFERASNIEREHTTLESPIALVNQAIVYQNMGRNNKAIQYLNKAAALVSNLKDEKQAAEYYHLTALVYFNLNDYHNALIYNNNSIRLGRKTTHSTLLEKAYLLSSKIYEAIYNYEEAMISFQNHLVIKDSVRRNQLAFQQNISDFAFTMEETARETERLWASEELSYLELQRLKLDSANRQQELEILYKADSIQRITIQNQQLENQRTLQALLLKEEQVYAAKKEKEVDSLRQIEKIQGLELESQALKQKEQQTQIELQEKELEVQDLNLKKVQTRIRWLAAFGVLAVIIIYLVVRGLQYAKKTNKILLKQKNEIERQKDEIDFEKKRSDKLLLNILPEETAEELKEKGTATPKQYEMVSVLFTDFKGFTNIAEKLTPTELVAELNNSFLEFDKIIDKYGLEKIKTIGDAYMCAGGIPVANETNPTDIVQAGLEIKEYMENLKAERESQGKDFWELRIGIHTGPVVAGVVGKNKFAYDIWGDAVNTASRMESSGIPGKVNVSGTTFELVKDSFICTYRGKIQAKNKGEIDMYIVEGKK